MSGAFTSKVIQLGKGPTRIRLLGDKTQRPESAQYVIEFPGGAVEVSRTTDGNYWAHIIINRGDVIDDVVGRCSSLGQVIDSRIGREHPHGIESIDNAGTIEQIAVLIKKTQKE